LWTVNVRSRRSDGSDMNPSESVNKSRRLRRKGYRELALGLKIVLPAKSGRSESDRSARRGMHRLALPDVQRQTDLHEISSASERFDALRGRYAIASGAARRPRALPPPGEHDREAKRRDAVQPLIPLFQSKRTVVTRMRAGPSHGDTGEVLEHMARAREISGDISDRPSRFAAIEAHARDLQRSREENAALRA